jgi:hypothetical protein
VDLTVVIAHDVAGGLFLDVAYVYFEDEPGRR